MILAQYTIRSKQEYIFRSNRLLDIVGGTEMIRDAFDWVFAAAEQEGVTCQPADVPFKLQAVQDAFAAGTLGMAELFRGGGNLTVLYRDRDTYLRVNRRFSRLVLENAPGMVPMAACCEANGQNYSADYSALMAAVDAEKNRMLPGRADYAAPFALRDRTTNQPIVCRVPFAGGQRELTAESRKKWEKGQRSDKRNDGNRLLDEMTTEWQEESLLAVIHADGNNMGVKIQQKLNGSIDYDFCVSTMRAFTAEIADAFTRTGETSLRDTMAYLQKEYHGLRETAYLTALWWPTAMTLPLSAMPALRWSTRATILKPCIRRRTTAPARVSVSSTAVTRWPAPTHWRSRPATMPKSRCTRHMPRSAGWTSITCTAALTAIWTTSAAGRKPTP